MKKAPQPTTDSRCVYHHALLLLLSRPLWVYVQFESFVHTLCFNEEQTACSLLKKREEKKS